MRLRLLAPIHSTEAAQIIQTQGTVYPTHWTRNHGLASENEVRPPMFPIAVPTSSTAEVAATSLPAHASSRWKTMRMKNM